TTSIYDRKSASRRNQRPDAYPYIHQDYLTSVATIRGIFRALPPSGSQFTVPIARSRAIADYLSNPVSGLIFAFRL
ncbi:hypothetical protein, partial [Klebsiella pneumoniae]|uniref:hypothetical protein n=1 Tax=Klebsiella pneumoniae TaxID=573 RepID=UPI001BA8A349